MEALGQLSDAERKVIDRAFFSGLTLTQLAQELGLPSAAVKAGIRHAMLVLRAALKQART
jgi:DNA-directed RNA polymerase specialized sigma24 family protein